MCMQASIGHRRDSTHHHRDSGLLKTVSACVAVTLTIQFLLSHGKHYACETDLVSGLWFCETKPKQNSQEVAIRTQEIRKGVSYFEDPFPFEPWMDAPSPDSEPGGLVARVDSSETDEISPAREKEALAALSAAKTNRLHGNMKKAKTIIEHALSLAPGHPDVLTEFGIVHEFEDNMIEADQCYARALFKDPKHVKALESRRRTQPIVNALDQKMLNGILKRKEQFSRLPHTASLRRAMRESYFLHIYHTVAIEGNTLSLGQTRSILETGIAVGGKSIQEHAEVIGMDSALRFLNQSLLVANSISLQDILEMHRRVLGNVNPIDAGTIRSTQVYVGRFTPVAPEYVADQMNELVDWLNSPATEEIDPVEKAAIAHYKLVVIHPFVDGNGRTARLLLNLILMRAGFPPVILPVESRAHYYAALNTANLGDLRPFIRYVASHTDSTLKHYISVSSPCEGDGCGVTSQFESESERITVGGD